MRQSACAVLVLVLGLGCDGAVLVADAGVDAHVELDAALDGGVDAGRDAGNRDVDAGPCVPLENGESMRLLVDCDRCVSARVSEGSLFWEMQDSTEGCVAPETRICCVPTSAICHHTPPALSGIASCR